MHISIHNYIYMYTYIYVHICLYLYICVPIHHTLSPICDHYYSHVNHLNGTLLETHDGGVAHTTVELTERDALHITLPPSSFDRPHRKECETHSDGYALLT